MVAVLVIATTGCGLVPSSLAGNHPVSSDGFPPIGPTTTVSGVVVNLDNGCIVLATDVNPGQLWVVWPPGATYHALDEHTNEIRLADGTQVQDGARIEIVGQLITRADLPDGGNSDSMWGSHAGFCLGATTKDPEIVRAETVAKA
ncbi:MAG: hypothetical protein QM779_11430 [Propionicimonas sp.]